MPTSKHLCLSKIEKRHITRTAKQTLPGSLKKAEKELEVGCANILWPRRFSAQPSPGDTHHPRHPYQILLWETYQPPVRQGPGLMG